MTTRVHRWTALAIAILSAGAGAAVAADPAAAERHYRIARRLVAEASPQAADALRATIEADPEGALADDARVELAVLLGAPRAPEGLGRIGVGDRETIAALLDAAAAPSADRAIEARYLGALLRLEPLPGRDPARARLDLIAIATDLDAPEPWPRAARAAVAWIDVTAGRVEAARAAWQRIVVDAPTSPEAVRAREGIARIEMRAGRFDRAAAALAGGSGGDPTLLELAVRGTLRWAGAGGTWQPASARVPVAVPGRGASAIAASTDGSVLLADRKAQSVVLVDVSGRERARWSIEDVDALAFDPFGRAWAATRDRIVRLDGDAPTTVVLLGRFGAVTAFAVDAAGTVYAVDRRGARVARFGADAVEPVDLWTATGARLNDLAWDGARLVAADEKGGRLLAISAEGHETPIAIAGLDKPVRLATDRAGQVAVLDDRADRVVLVGPDGSVRDRLALTDVGVTRPAGIALGPDGALDVLDAATGRLVRLP